MNRVIVWLAGILLLGWMVSLLTTAAIGERLPQENEFVFYTHRPYGIYRSAVDRGLSVPMIVTKNSVIQPDWSPTGQQISFVDNTSARLILYLADASGRHAHPLTDEATISDYDPKWSPDGRYIAYVTSSGSTRNGQKLTIDVMLFDTQSQSKRRLATTNIYREHMLYWSPDGAQVAYVLYSPEQANSDIYSINIRTGAISTFISTAGNDEYPVWSPDGAYIAFVSGTAQRGIYLMDINSRKISLLYTLSGISYPSDWSQDSRFLYLSSAFNIYKLDVANCLENPQTCTPELLIKGGGDARRKPRLP